MPCFAILNSASQRRCIVRETRAGQASRCPALGAGRAPAIWASPRRGELWRLLTLTAPGFSGGAVRRGGCGSYAAAAPQCAAHPHSGALQRSPLPPPSSQPRRAPAGSSPRAMVFRGGSLTAREPSLTADGKHVLIIAGNDVRLYSAVSGDQLSTLSGHTAAVTAVVLDPKHASQVSGASRAAGSPTGRAAPGAAMGAACLARACQPRGRTSCCVSDLFSKNRKLCRSPGDPAR